MNLHTHETQPLINGK